MKDTLQATDGHTLSAYVAQPTGTPKGAVIVVQEIFGVNSHIRAVADGYAAAGYLAIAPAMFDRVQRDYEAGYSQDEIGQGIEIMKQLDFDNALLDINAALSKVPADLKSGVVGYCFGGSIAWLAAQRLSKLSASVCYYGGAIPNFVEEPLRCPTMLHFGNQDGSLPLDKAQAVAQKYPDAISHFYEADHGFNCDQRGSYNQEASQLALTRTLEFLARHLAAN